MKRIFAGLSLLLDLAVLAGVVWMGWWGGFQKLVGGFIQPMHGKA